MKKKPEEETCGMAGCSAEVFRVLKRAKHLPREEGSGEPWENFRWHVEALRQSVPRLSGREKRKAVMFLASLAASIATSLSARCFVGILFDNLPAL
jgi:hypothetical protein